MSTNKVITGNFSFADLVAGALSATNVAQAGQLITASWLVTNAGTATAIAPWQERLLLADNPVGSNGLTLVTSLANGSLLASNQVARSQSFILPAGLSGSYWLVVQVDSGNQIFEGNKEDNNFLVAALPIQIQSPDLRVSLLTSAVTAAFGQPFNVTWEVTNSGNGSALASWSDRVWLSSASNSISGASLLTSSTAVVSPLQPGGSYSNGTAISIPLNAQSQPGAYWLVAQADGTTWQPESNEGNNLRSVPLTLTMPPLPDLVAGRLAAAASVSSGQTVTLTYAVTNSGSASLTNAIWRESVYLLSDSGLNETNVQSLLGSGVALATFTVTNTLSAGTALIRTQAVAVPLNSLLANTRFVVAVDVANTVIESNETNNIALATNVTVIPALLTLQLPASQFLEGTAMTATVIRNGSTSVPLIVTLTNDDPTEVSFVLNGTNNLTTIIIPAGSSSAQFPVSALNDGVVDGSQLVNISAAATNFSTTSASVIVLDAQVPHLTLNIATNSVTEGLTVAATVTRDYVTTNALTVFLQSSSSRLFVPTSVIIPAGSNSRSFTLQAVNNSLIELPGLIFVSATASGFTGSSSSTTVFDDDTPTVTLTLAQTNVSESAGPQATVGTVTRSPVGSGQAFISLQSSDTAKAMVPSSVTIPGGQASASFYVSAFDNAVADGPHTVLITPTILASANGPAVATGTPATLTLLDDDGPTLKLVFAKKLVPEGQNPATTATVTRNTPTTNALVVTLVSSNTNETTVPVSVTIPQGQTSAQFNITSINDGVTDGSKIATITATAAGFTPGLDALVVSDVNLSDLVVSEVGAPASVDTETYFNVTYRVANQGVATSGSNFLTRIFLSTDPIIGNDTLLGQYTFTGTMPPGLFFSQTLSVLTPSAAGQYWIIASTDVGEVVAEVLEDNNTTVASSPITVVAAYGATIQADLESAPAGTPVPMHGHATNSLGAPAPFKLVNIHIGMQGTLRKISALTDASGNFSTVWQPLANEAGFYSLGADYLGAATTAVQDQFTLYGFKADPANPSLSVADQSSVAGFIKLKNQGDVALTGMSASVISKPSNLTVTVSLKGTSENCFSELG